DATAGTGHFEVHVAVVIFGARDVAEYRVLPGFLVHHESHRDPGDRCLEWHAGVHHAERAAADRRHRRRPVRLENVGYDPHRVRERFLSRNHWRQRAFRQCSVTDFAAAGPAQERHLTDGEGREIVVEHETLPLFALEALNLLRVVGGAERAGDERL